MNNNQKRFILEEYDPNFDYTKKKSSLNISFNRIAFILFIFFFNYINFFFQGSLLKFFK